MRRSADHQVTFQKIGVFFRNPCHSEQHHPHVTEFSYNPKFSEQRLNRVCFDDCSFQILKINSTTKKVTLSCGWSIGAVCPTANLIFSWVTCLLLVRFFPKEKVTHGKITTQISPSVGYLRIDDLIGINPGPTFPVSCPRDSGIFLSPPLTFPHLHLWHPWCGE